MIEHIDGLLLFPLAFGLLVMQKTYSIAKSAVVPSLVRNDIELVEANAKLAMVSSVCSMVGAAIGGIALLISSSAPAVVAVIGYALTLMTAVLVPKVLVAASPASAGATRRFCRRTRNSNCRTIAGSPAMKGGRPVAGGSCLKSTKISMCARPNLSSRGCGCRRGGRGGRGAAARAGARAGRPPGTQPQRSLRRGARGRSGRRGRRR